MQSIFLLTAALALWTILGYASYKIDLWRKPVRPCRAHYFGVPDTNPCLKCGTYVDFTPNPN